MELTKEEQEQIVANVKAMHERILNNIKDRMTDLSKDEELKEQTRKELHGK